MLEINVPAQEYFDEVNSSFIRTDGGVLQLEHSLVSLSKWESMYKKSFLSRSKNNPPSSEEMIDYIKCMTLNQVNPEIYDGLTNENITTIVNYIGDSMTATTINRENQKHSSSVITSEVIYQWMVALQIPFECQYWHLNRLLTLIEVCNIKSKPPKKMSQKQAAHRNRSLNAQRRAKLGSKG